MDYSKEEVLVSWSRMCENASHMKYSLLSSGLIISILVLPIYGHASDPFENYNQYVSTDRENDAFASECKSELGIEDGDQTVGPKLFYYRRCLNTKTEAARRQKIVEQRNIRMKLRTMRRSRAGRIIEQLSERDRSRSLDDVRRKHFESRRAKRSKNRLKKLSAVRRSRRVDVQYQERIRDQRISNNAEARRNIRRGCDHTTSAEERTTCIWTQLHNLNLQDN